VLIAQRAAQAGLAVKPEMDDQGPAVIDRANKAMIQEATTAIEGFALPIFPSHGNFWCWKPSRPVSARKRWSNVFAGRAL